MQKQIGKCEEIELDIKEWDKAAELLLIRGEFSQKRRDLAAIQDLFQKQTEQVIQAYQKIEA